MTSLTAQQIRDAIQQGLEETWRLIDSGKKIQLVPEPKRRACDGGAVDRVPQIDRSK
jgi:hypothetical protein